MLKVDVVVDGNGSLSTFSSSTALEEVGAARLRHASGGNIKSTGELERDAARLYVVAVPNKNPTI